MTKIKFKFHQKPLSDEQIGSFKNFDSLMTAFVANPKPSLRYQLTHNRILIYTTGIMSGIIITTIATLFILKTETTQLTQPLNTVTPQQTSVINAKKESAGSPTVDPAGTEISSTTPTTEINNNEPKKTSTAVSVQPENSSTKKSVKKSEKIVNAGSPAGDPAGKLGVKTSPKKSMNTMTAKSPSGDYAGKKEKRTQTTTSSEPVTLNSNDNSVTVNGNASQNSDLNISSSESLINNLVEENSSTNNSETSETSSSNYQTKGSRTQSENNYSSEQIAELPNQQLDDSSKKKITDVTAEVGNKVVELSKNITDESKTSYAWTREKLNYIFASGNREKKERSRDTVTLQTRPAQVSFLYPIGSNGITSGKYVNNFSLNILTGFNGGVNGCEIGGLVNVDRKNINGLQIAGLTNVAFGKLNGAQIGGLVNQSKSVNGAQIGGLVNTAIGSVKGAQIGGIINYALDSIDGAQIGGIANISTTFHKVNGVQIGGIANLALGKMNGSQISGIVNVANRINGFQISLINVGVTVKGSQIGLINISDSLSGVPIGLISISRTGMFHLDLFSNDFSYANTCLRLGSNQFYNIFAIGFSPNTSQGNRISYGYGIGSHINATKNKKVFVNIDALAWNVHYNNLSDWSTGINMVNQLRILPGWQITKGCGLYAGPCINVEVIDDGYNSAVKSHLFSQHGAGTTGVNEWIGWTVGLQFF